MKNRSASELETKLGERPKLRNDKRERLQWWTLASLLLLGLLGLTAAPGSARAGTIAGSNLAAITTPDSGQAALYPSNITFAGFAGTVSKVRVTLNNITHTFPADYDILLVGPGGQRTVLMSDAGGAADLNNVSLTFSDFASPLPQGSQITAGTYRPSNYSSGSTSTDAFPPNAAQNYSSSLSVFNNTPLNGTWSLFVVDDASGDVGTIANGWTITIDYNGFQGSGMTIPGAGTSGPASPYPSQINVAGLPTNLRRAHVEFYQLTHTFPDDLDVLLVGPGGQNAIIMSDVGGSGDISNLIFTLDDAAASALPDGGPLVAGTFRPTNINDGVDTFAAPAPAPSGGSALSAFSNTNPNGAWKLFIMDDAAGDTGSLALWFVDFDLDPPILANVSTRLSVQTGANVLIGGFIVTGTQAKNVIVRAIGPSLGLPGQLEDPTLELRDGMGGLIWFNDDWQSGSQGFPSQAGAISATGIPPSNGLESAIVATLPANNSNYTATVKGFNNLTGIGLVEVYDLNRTADSKLANISTRGLVQTGNNVLIAGTIALGWPASRVIIRGIGPSLPVAGALADPTLELRDGMGTLIASNDNWRSDQESEIISTTIPPTSNLESAIVVTLPANGASYTATLRGAGGGTGVGLVEIYALN